MRLSAALKVRFARGTARDGQWCEINHRPVDWASRSLTREFEHVIMVDVLIGEMVGSDRSPPERLQRAFGAECQRSSTRPKWRCSQRRSGRVTTTELTEPTLLEMPVNHAENSNSSWQRTSCPSSSTCCKCKLVF